MLGNETGSDESVSLASSVVMDMIGNYLDKGHSLYVDNFYASVYLANISLARNTHIVGTVNHQILTFS